jgi:hypothetical protein
MWKEIQEFILWMRGYEDIKEPEEAAVSSLVRLVALNSLATIHEANRRDEEDWPEANPTSDASSPPSAAE